MLSNIFCTLLSIHVSCTDPKRRFTEFFEIQGIIGQGGFGAVYGGVAKDTRKPVSVCVRSHLLTLMVVSSIVCAQSTPHVSVYTDSTYLCTCCAVWCVLCV